MLLRSLILCTAYFAFVLSIAAMPIANSVAIYFTMPFFVAGLAGPLLGERVRIYRWLAIIAGFIGVHRHGAARVPECSSPPPCWRSIRPSAMPGAR